MGYCDTSDLLLGDAIVGPGNPLSKWVDRAAGEMDSKLGFRYVVPITPNPNSDPPFTELLPHEAGLLKQINSKLASGRFLMAQAQSGEFDTTHAYGRSLLTEALSELYCITNGEVDLTSAELSPTSGGLEYRRMPGITNEDEESLLLGWENNVLRGVPWYTRPGKPVLNPFTGLAESQQ